MHVCAHRWRLILLLGDSLGRRVTHCSLPFLYVRKCDDTGINVVAWLCAIDVVSDACLRCVDWGLDRIEGRGMYAVPFEIVRPAGGREMKVACKSSNHEQKRRRTGRREIREGRGVVGAPQRQKNKNRTRSRNGRERRGGQAAPNGSCKSSQARASLHLH